MQLDEKEIQCLKEATAEEALDLLYDKYSGIIYGVCCKMLGDDTLAQDTTQEIFVKIWRHWDRYDWHKAPLFGWIMLITKRTIYDQLRSRRTRQDHLQSPHFTSQAKSGISLQQDSIDLEDQVGKLDRDLAKLINLLYFAGHTQVEASKILDIPLGTVKSRARKALRCLRDIYIRSDLKTILPFYGLLIFSIWIV